MLLVHRRQTAGRRLMTGASPFQPTRHVGILVFDKFEPLDVWGFVEAFSISRFIGTGYASGPPYPFQVKLISNATKPKSGGLKARRRWRA